MDPMKDLCLNTSGHASHDAWHLRAWSLLVDTVSVDVVIVVLSIAIGIAATLLVSAVLRAFHVGGARAKKGSFREAQSSHSRAEQLESAHRQLRSLYERLQQTETLRSRFLAKVSHELRTPLSLILGTTETVLLGDDPDLSYGTARTIRKNALLLYRHVDDLLALARNDAGELRIRYARTDLSALLRDTAAHFAGSRSRAIFGSRSKPLPS